MPLNKENQTETINHIISECNKLTKREYKTRYEWVGKMINWESCKGMVFAQTKIQMTTLSDK